MKRILATLALFLICLVGFTQNTYVYKSLKTEVKRYDEATEDYKTTASKTVLTWLYISTKDAEIYNTQTEKWFKIEFDEMVSKSKDDEDGTLFFMYKGHVKEKTETVLVSLLFEADGTLKSVGVSDKDIEVMILYSDMTYERKS